MGLVLPGFVATEGFPQRELRDRLATRWLVSTPERVAEAIIDAGPGGKAERYVPRGYGLVAAPRVLAPRLVRRVTRRLAAALTPATGARERLTGRGAASPRFCRRLLFAALGCVRVRVAVVDMGTNSTRLLVADVVDGRVRELDRRSTVTRLGRGVDTSGQLAAEAIEEVCAAVAALHRRSTRSSAPSGCARSRPAPSATPRTARCSSPSCASASPSTPGSSTAPRRQG